MDGVLNERLIGKIAITDFMGCLEYSFEENSKKDESNNCTKRTIKRSGL